ncbi:MAG: T9SS type A sorting domain-containing protein [Bacteroidia bacterium]|nr:T9SS type A sorting domain-containing protein [Bacteroidia bacterium]
MRNLILLFLLATATFSFGQAPTSYFAVPSEYVCTNQITTVVYTGNASPSAIYIWDFGSGQIVSGSGQGPIQVSFPIAGTITISLTVIQYPDTSVTTSGDMYVSLCNGIENVKNTNWLITPNPAIDKVYIKTSLSNAVAEFFDLNGKILLKEIIISDKQCDISKFNKGVYVVKLTSDHKTYFKTLIKE